MPPQSDGNALTPADRPAIETAPTSPNATLQCLFVRSADVAEVGSSPCPPVQFSRPADYGSLSICTVNAPIYIYILERRVRG